MANWSCPSCGSAAIIKGPYGHCRCLMCKDKWEEPVGERTSGIQIRVKGTEAYRRA